MVQIVVQVRLLGLYTKLTDRPVVPTTYTATFNKTTIKRLSFKIHLFI